MSTLRLGALIGNIVMKVKNLKLNKEVSMNNSTFFPPLIALAYIGDQEIRVINIYNNLIHFESADTVLNMFDCKASILNFNTHKYAHFNFMQCKIIERQHKSFSHVYTAEIGYIPPEETNEYREVMEKLELYFNMKEQYGVFRKVIANGFLNDKFQSYPFNKDELFCSNMAEQENEWYGSIDTNISHEEFVQAVSNVELAFNINSSALYKQFDKMEISEAIAENIDKYDLLNHGIFSKPFSRVYIGNEFCPNIFPDKQQLFRLLNKAHESNYKITLSFSTLNENRINSLKDILGDIEAWCINTHTSIEIIVNDWGMLEILSGHPKFQPILGRLLNRRKKDPRLKWLRGFSSDYEDFKENNLNCDHFLNFLNGSGISRFEFETGMSYLKIPVGRHSLHFPFYQINSSAFCVLYAHCNLKKPDLVHPSCPNYCSEFYFQYPKHLNIIGKGNSIFGFDNSVLVNADKLQNFISNGIDRLVYSVG